MYINIYYYWLRIHAFETENNTLSLVSVNYIVKDLSNKWDHFEVTLKTKLKNSFWGHPNQSGYGLVLINS